MKKINVCFLERKGGGYFLWSLSQVTVWPGTLLLMVLWTKGLILQPSFHTCTMCVQPFLWSQQCPLGHCTWEDLQDEAPNPFFHAFPFKLVQWESKYPELTVTPVVEHRWAWKSTWILWMTASSSLPVLKPQPTALSRLAKKPPLKCLAIGCHQGRPKEGHETVHGRTGTWVRCNQLLHGSVLGLGPQGMRHGSHWQRRGNKPKT